MTEKTIEIGVVTVPTPEELEAGKVGAECGGGRGSKRRAIDGVLDEGR